MKLFALIQSLLIFNIFIVQSGSMEPVIHTGSVVVSIKSNNYSQNDVISYYSDSSKKTVVTHRIVGKIDGKYLTSGDANSTIDEVKIPQSQIIGKVYLTVPYLGYFFNYAKTPKGLILLVLIPATIIIYEELKFIFGEIKKRIKINLKFNKAYLLIPTIPIIGSFIFLSNYSGAFFSDTKVSSNNTFTASIPLQGKTALLYNSDQYICSLGATDFSTQQMKNVVFTSNGNNIDIKVELIGATPNSNYDLWVNQDIGACPLNSPTLSNAVTTDVNGNGIVNYSIAKLGGATKIWISLVGGGQVLRSTSVDL